MPAEDADDKKGKADGKGALADHTWPGEAAPAGDANRAAEHELLAPQRGLDKSLPLTHVRYTLSRFHGL